MLKKTAAASGVAALAMVGLGYSSPAKAQVEARTHELHAYAGYLFGDDLTDTQISGATPELDGDFTAGVRYVYNFNEALGFDASFGYSPNAATGLATGGDIDLDIMTLDLDAVWNFMPGGQLVPYVLGGVGYASADLDRPITGLVNGLPVQIDDDDGFTFNAGVGMKYFFSESVQLRVEARYRYMDALVDNFDDSLNTFEATIGAGMTF